MAAVGVISRGPLLFKGKSNNFLLCLQQSNCCATRPFSPCSYQSFKVMAINTIAMAMASSHGELNF